MKVEEMQELQPDHLYWVFYTLHNIHYHEPALLRPSRDFLVIGSSSPISSENVVFVGERIDRPESEMLTKDPEPGVYRVLYNGTEHVGEFHASSKLWLLTGMTERLSTWQLDLILNKLV